MNSRITAREEEVLRLIAQGHITKQIAYELGISFKTVATHRANLMTKLSVGNAAELVLRGMESGFLESPKNRTSAPQEVGSLQDLVSKCDESMQEFRMARNDLRAAMAEWRETLASVSVSRRSLEATRIEIHAANVTLSQTWGGGFSGPL